MKVTAATAAGSTQERASAERRFFGRMAIFMIVVVIIGFAPSFYLRGLVFSPRPNPTLPPMVLTHGIVFSLWMLLFLAQTKLVAAGRRDLHMKLGVAGFGLAVLMIPLMYLTAVGQPARANQPPFATPLAWTAIPLAAIPAITLLLALGWRHRRNPEAHKRLMLGVALGMMDPAVERIPLLPPTYVSSWILGLLALAMFTPLFVWDRKRMGRLHWATKTAFGAAAAAQVAGKLLSVTPAWSDFAAMLPGMRS